MKENRRTIVVLVGFCLLFIGLVIYMSWFQIFQAEEVKNNPYNKRLWMNEEKVARGSIVDRNGVVLAYSEKTEESNNRYYNYGKLYSHIIGYSYREYGKAGLELNYNNTLLNINQSETLTDIKNLVLPSSVGNNLKLTIDHNMQVKTKELLNGRKGAAVAMNPKTGEIYSMVSLPDFDAGNLREEWQNISEDPNSPLLNRATQGMYAPGSIFKIITTTAIMDTPGIDMSYSCNGKSTIGGYEFHDYNSIAHGDIDLRGALVNSCNTYYANKAVEVGTEKLGKTADKFMFNNQVKFDIPLKTSIFKYKNGLDKTKLAASSIGQGDVLVTPLNMAMMASTIANDGVMVKPILVKEIMNKDGRVIKSIETEELSEAMDSFTAKEIGSMMRDVVVSGTGKNAGIRNVKVAGKTGTAENASGKTHSWFVGYASEDNPNLVVTVILEESGLTGGKGAAPIARDMMIYGLNNIKFEE